jgi:hypothetical protein
MDWNLLLVVAVVALMLILMLGMSGKGIGGG